MFKINFSKDFVMIKISTTMKEFAYYANSFIDKLC